LIVRGERILKRHIEILTRIRESATTTNGDDEDEGAGGDGDRDEGNLSFASGCFITGCSDKLLKSLKVYRSHVS